MTNVPLMLTGGFKRLDQAVDAIANDVVDIIGLGRAMVLDPRIDNTWLRGKEFDFDFPRFERTIPGGITAWYTMRIVALGENREHEYTLDLPTALEQYEERDAKRCIRWQKKFSPIR